ncbi:MAG TPA: hypothetical protein VJW20_04755 [Candidatus Angelobacter sp.]|nr:hypothetical protein [Candidatus Angelobacter sp.]
MNTNVNWIEDMVRQDELRDAQNTANEKEEQAALLLITQKGPEFLNQVHKKNQIAVDALKEKTKLSGSLSNGTHPLDSAESIYRVEVTNNHVIPKQAYIELHYSKRNPLVIRCVPMEDDSYRAYLRVQNNNVVVLCPTLDGDRLMNELEFSTFIMKQLVENVRD